MVWSSIYLSFLKFLLEIFLFYSEEVVHTFIKFIYKYEIVLMPL